MSASHAARRTVVVATLAATIAMLGQGVASAAPGDVDTSFGDAGAKTITVGAANSVGGLVQRADGSFVIGDSVGTAVMTVALRRNGQPLHSYGSNGISSFPVPGGITVHVTDIALMSGGRTIVAGWADNGAGGFVVARFRAGGGADHSFSGNGIARIAFPQGPAYGYGIAVQSDGKIVVVGEVDPTSSVSNPAMARLRADGSIDTTFGTHGRLVVKVPDGIKAYDGVWRVVQGPSGNLVTAGWAQRKDHSYKTLAIRLTSRGTLDHSFGGDGIVVLDADGTDNWSYALALDGTKPVMGIHTSGDRAGFVRLMSDGRRDATFGGDGVAIHTLSIPWEVGSLAVLPDHRIVASNNRDGGPDIVQLKPGGKLDKTFGAAGEATGPLANIQAAGLIYTSAKKIVVAGMDATNEIVATRFLGP